MEAIREIASRPYWRENEARQLHEAWRRSGSSMTDFARGLGCEPRRLGRWFRQLGEAMALEAPPRPASPATRFIEVTSPKAKAAEHPLELVVGGVVVRVPTGFDETTLRRVLDTLSVKPC
jgi:hypothetical protein